PTGSLVQRTRIALDGAPLLIERLAFTAGDALLDADYGLAGRKVWGALYACPADASVLATARAALGALGPVGGLGAERTDDARYGATLLDGLLVVRYLGTRHEAARTALESVWAAIRAAVVGRAPCPPRIWRT